MVSLHAEERKDPNVQQLEAMVRGAAADRVISFEEFRSLTEWSLKHEISKEVFEHTLEVVLAEAREQGHEVELQSAPPELSSKEKGDRFEEYIVEKFNRRFFELKEWRGDKISTSGRFATSAMRPDLELELRTKEGRFTFAVECKWRGSPRPDGTVEWCKDQQLERYRAFAAEQEMPVFVALGVGGDPDDPEYLYIIPLDALETPRVSRADVDRFWKNTSKPLYYDAEAKMLR